MVIKALDAVEEISCVMREYDVIQHVYAGYKLYQTEVHMLEQIGFCPGIGASQLAKIFHKTVSACSQIIRKLLQKGLITQQSAPENARIRKLYLTEAGKAVYEDHYRLENRYINRDINEFKDISIQEIEHFLKVCAIIRKCFCLDLDEQKKKLARLKKPVTLKPNLTKPKTNKESREDK